MTETGTARPARPGGVLAGPDGRLRCPWPGTQPDYLAYHDDEWGRPVHDEVRLFERLCLEGFQAGLSWLTILRKRQGFRRAFAGFDPATVAAFDEDDVARLLGDAAIVRSRRKIESTVANARALLAMDGTLDALVWGLAPPPSPPPQVLADIPATTPESVTLAAELRARGFRMVGPTTAYALMQACGVVNDHLAGCFARDRSGSSGPGPVVGSEGPDT
jgi:DNA-3-methyladenine glycosylase I